MNYCNYRTLVGYSPPKRPGESTRQAHARWTSQPANILEPLMRCHGAYFSRWKIHTKPHAPHILHIKHLFEEQASSYQAAQLRKIIALSQWHDIPGYRNCVDHRDQQLLQQCVKQWLESRDQEQCKPSSP